MDKCEFCKPEVRYLGRLVSAEGYRPDPKDTAALIKFREAPKTVGEVRSLVGRKFLILLDRGDPHVLLKFLFLT